MKKKRRKKHKKRIKQVATGLVSILIVYSVYIYCSIPDSSSLKTINPAITMLMEDRVEQAKRKNRKYNPDRRWVNISEISKEILRAVVIAEDSTFFQHRGIEFAEWKFALYEAITQFKFPRGASTITQQLAKNIYLYNDGLINRKIKEILMARRLEKDLTKKRILELYLNIIEWGDGIFGVEAASKHYFNKSASEIDRGQAAFLAAIIPSPIGAFNPKKHPERVADRADLILLRMNTVITLKY